MFKDESVETQKEYHFFSKKEMNKAVEEIKKINQQITRRDEQLKSYTINELQQNEISKENS